MLSAIRYSVKSECLIPWIKFLWYFEKENAEVCHKLLPTDSIDLIINLSNDMIYETDSGKITAPRLHINGLRDKYSYIHQAGNICVLGISFYSFGLFPFVHKPLEHIRNKIIDLHTLSLPLAQKLKSAVSDTIAADTINLIEKTLCSELNVKNNYLYKAAIMRDFMESEDEITIKSFCDDHGINIKTLERMFLHYSGYTPKLLRRLKRFQLTSSQLVHQNQEKLINVACDNSFTDQAHLIKEFHRFSGKAPLSFLNEKITIKENTKYSYI
jgi:AraC-like DNA-binding protein